MFFISVQLYEVYLCYTYILPIVLAAQVQKIMLLTKGIVLIVVNVVFSVENAGNQVCS